MSLRQQVFKGAKWTAISSVVVTGAYFLQVTVLANLLTPEQFGLVSLIIVVVGLLRQTVDGGLSNAIIFRQDVTREQLSSLYWLTLAIGAALFGLLHLCRPLIVAFFEEPRLDPLLMWASVALLMLPFGQQYKALLQKELEFNTLATAEASAAVVGTAVAITTAWLGAGAIAMVYGLLAQDGVLALMLVAVGLRRFRPQLRFRVGDLKGYVSFGLYQLGERSINYFSANVDYLLVGKYLGPELLGMYTLAYQLVVVPFTRINPIVTRVAFPAFAMRQSDDAALRRGYADILRLLSLVVMPATLGLAATANVAIPVLFGPQWEQTAQLVQVMTLMSLLLALGNPSGSITLAKGRADLAFWWNVWVGAIKAGVLWLAVQLGIFAVAGSLVLLAAGFFVVGQRKLVFDLIGMTWREFFAAVWRPLVYSVAMAAVVYGTYLGLALVAMPDLAVFLLLVLLGVAVYGGLILKFEAAQVRQIVAMVRKRRLSAAAAGAATDAASPAEPAQEPQDGSGPINRSR